MYKVDLHTHSIMSFDGSISEKDYRQILESGKLDFVAITDHNTIEFAQKLQKKLGDKIIVGEEITTQEGDIIGLFLAEKTEPGLTLSEAIQEIHRQKGLVYMPHPCDTLRKGIGEKLLLKYKKGIDIIEGFNARMIVRSYNLKAQEFARKCTMPMGVGSDAHTKYGLGSAYVLVDEIFTRKNALTLLQNAYFHVHYQPLLAFLAPKINKIKQKLVIKFIKL